MWIDRSALEAVQAAGILVWDPRGCLAAVLEHVVCEEIERFIGPYHAAEVAHPRLGS